MFFLLLRVIASEDELRGTYSSRGKFLPLVPESSVEAKGLFVEYPDLKIPYKPLLRFVSTFKVNNYDVYGLHKVFGHITSPTDSTDFIFNFTSYGVGGRISNEAVTSYAHYLQFQGFEPGTYGLDVFAKVVGQDGENKSILLFNDTVTFYEVTNYYETIGIVLLYVFFVLLLGFILYRIFTKDARRMLGAPSKAKPDSRGSFTVGRKGSPSPRDASPGGRGDSPSDKDDKRNKRSKSQSD